MYKERNVMINHLFRVHFLLIGFMCSTVYSFIKTKKKKPIYFSDCQKCFNAIEICFNWKKFIKLKVHKSQIFLIPIVKMKCARERK